MRRHFSDSADVVQKYIINQYNCTINQYLHYLNICLNIKFLIKINKSAHAHTCMRARVRTHTHTHTKLLLYMNN